MVVNDCNALSEEN